jgi:SAM-dependent methyltransferase
VNRGAYHRPPADYARTRAFPPQAEAQIARSLRQAVPEGARVVDIGAGTGRLTHLLLGERFSVLALDLSAAMLAYLQENRPHNEAPLRLAVCDVTDLPARSGTFHAAVSVHVLHLVADWRTALSEALRVLVPGGVFLLGLTEHDPTDPAQQVALQWKEILRAHETQAPDSVFSEEEVDRRMDSHGASCRRVVAAEWWRWRSPAEQLQRIGERMYPRFRQIPDEAFAQMYAQLQEWSRLRFHPLEKPSESRVQFVWRVYRTPLSQTPDPC